jgi:cysteine desulfurase family protein (TIGR01976 family)
MQKFINAKQVEEIMIGSSTTMLLRILSLCISQGLQADDEVIITNCDHEANMACWRDLEKIGIKVKTWRINQKSYQMELDDLKRLLSPNTKLVAVTHVSNILGTINPIQQIAKIVHENNSLICVDGVAFAPHRMIDVQELDVDFYVFSTYKTFGPHQALMYGKYDLFKNMVGINHPFINEVPYKFQPGNLNYELTYSLAAIPEYITQIGDGILSDGFEAISRYEQELVELLLSYLNSNPKIRIIGESSADKNLRVATISFVHSELDSKTIVEQVDPYNIGIRFGDFYAVHLIDDLGLREKNGVVRVSLVHYNTHKEVKMFLKVLKTIL